jgi:uncharacterized membrane protein
MVIIQGLVNKNKFSWYTLMFLLFLGARVIVLVLFMFVLTDAIETNTKRELIQQAYNKERKKQRVVPLH